jgi:hypothetical protein
MSCVHGCEGKRHLFNKEKGLWEKCLCLLTEERDKVAEVARIPNAYWATTIDGIEAYSPSKKATKLTLQELATALKQEKIPFHHRFITGKPHVVRVVGYLLLKAALFRHRGITCGLDELTTWFLLQDKSAFNAIREIPVLNLFFGTEYKQPIHEYLLKHVVEYRAEPRFVTLYTTPTNHMGMVQSYGQHEAWQADKHWIKLAEDLQI